MASQGSNTCSDCGADNMYSTTAGMETCSTCPQGSYTSGVGSSTNNRTSCTACPDGYTCDGTSTKTPCAAGTYAAAPVASFMVADVHTCRSCGDDTYYSPGTSASWAAGACKLCGATSYTGGGDANTRTTCTTCDAGSSCNGGATQTACAAGTAARS